MATFTAFQSQDMINPTIWYGTVIEATSKRITLSNYAGTSGVYSGIFNFSASDLVGGVVTSYESYRNYRLDYTFSGVSLDAVTVERFTELGDAIGLSQYAYGGNDEMYGSSFADTLVGWDGNDAIYGGSGIDVLYGGNGNDTLNGGGGIEDYLFGGHGLDTVVFAGSSAQYERTLNPDFELGFIVRDFVSNRDGTDYLIEAERLRFTDTNIALDRAGTAGQAYRIYEAVLGRAPDLVGLGYWINDMDNGVSLTTIAQGFIASPEFQNKYGVNPSYETYVNLLYNNILDRDPDPVGLNYWVSNMQKGIDSPAVVLASFSEGYENTANVAPDIANGIYYTDWTT